MSILLGNLCHHVFSPCRLCPHVVVVVGLVCFEDPWSYAVEPLIPDRPKVRFQNKRDTEVNAVCGQMGFATGTCLLMSASDPGTE